ncbi:MAG: transcription-repair coupling factor [Rhabdochlamydiaceae bacterium]
MQDNYLDHPEFFHLKDRLLNQKSVVIDDLHPSAKAAFIAFLARSFSGKVLVITACQDNQLLLNNLDFFLSPIKALEFPSWETLPGEDISPSPDIVGQRLEILHTLANSSSSLVIVAPLQAVLQKTLSKHFITSSCLNVSKGDLLPFQSLKEELLNRGYEQVPVVSDKGEFALRGHILDIFPISHPEPVRLDFFDDTIEEIRLFDPISQKSIKKISSIFIPPAQELEFLKKGDLVGSLLDFLGKDSLILFDNLLQMEDSYINWQKQPAFNSPLFSSFETFFRQSLNYKHYYFPNESIENFTEKKKPYLENSFVDFEWLNQRISALKINSPFSNPLDRLTGEEGSLEDLFVDYVASLKTKITIHMICLQEKETIFWKEKLSSLSTSITVVIQKGYLSHPLALKNDFLWLIPSTAFTHEAKMRRGSFRHTYHTSPSSFHQLSYGDIVVHFHQGIGKYLGIEEKPNHLGIATEFMVIEFSAGSKLFVPVSQSHLISRYIGAKESLPVLSVLGTTKWQKIKQQAEKNIIGYAHSLLKWEAERTIKGGFPYPEDSLDMELFEKEFPFQETEDQLRAIEEIKRDMRSNKAMDRLVCGDVGYGKTEVAMRAAFKAVCDGKKQVAVLVPTTVLAVQHYESFKARMKNFPVNLGIVSRFHSTKQTKETLQKTQEGQIDILIGTHRLISKDVHFKDLGLLIIDEEQRFGVKAKEHLKGLKTGIDCLTLSATPIPRTLYLSLIGARQISVINTPPQDRLPIKSIIAEKDPTLIQNALIRELSRGGQAYFIHNRVDNLPKIAENLKTQVPQAKISVAHGQMDPQDLEQTFLSFKKGETNILLATTIIENGVDIPNANTILIDQADSFGLADLYQMRGRVGRWNKPAYAYFLTAPRKVLSEMGYKRLQALAESSGYGGGMKIAMRDLEIRGAGDILGVDQSGQIATIGFHLYCKLLKRTVDALQKNKNPSFTETKIECPYNARLPQDYVSDTEVRLEIYHRLGDASSFEEVDGLLNELEDRFGPPPKEVKWLYHLARIRIMCQSKKILLLKIEPFKLILENHREERKIFTIPKIIKPEELENTLDKILAVC